MTRKRREIEQAIEELAEPDSAEESDAGHLDEAEKRRLAEEFGVSWEKCEDLGLADLLRAANTREDA